jgi:hypothetical protein
LTEEVFDGARPFEGGLLALRTDRAPAGALSERRATPRTHRTDRGNIRALALGRRDGPIGTSTLYQWLNAYQASPRLQSLMPRRRPAGSGAGAIIKAEWIEHALGLIEEEPKRSLFILGKRLQRAFSLPKAPSRSSLHRALRREPRYRTALRSLHTKQRRGRFQTTRAHLIWQGDAKAEPG